MHTSRNPQFPSRAGRSRRVSFDERYGTCTRAPPPSASRDTTLPNASRLWLIDPASFSCTPSALDSAARSAPARSTSVRVLDRTSVSPSPALSSAPPSPGRFSLSCLRWSRATRWDLDDREFVLRLDVSRACWACSRKASHSSRDVTRTWAPLSTTTPPPRAASSSRRGLWRAVPDCSRSNTCSLYTSKTESRSSKLSSPSALPRSHSRWLNTSFTQNRERAAMVCVFPVLVAPYAQTAPLTPCRNPSTIPAAPLSLYTSLQVSIGPNALSNW